MTKPVFFAKDTGFAIDLKPLKDESFRGLCYAIV